MKKKFLIGVLLTSLLPMNVLALDKSENIYVNLDNSGKPYQTIINSHIHNTSFGELKDTTNLKNILNINGKETFELDNQNLTWNAFGNDIIYRGTSEKELPIKVDIKYYLDDEEKKIDDIIGQSGKVKIKINFTNDMYFKSKDMYAPFVVTVGTILDNTNKNIEVTNGKVINTGTKNLLFSISAPGLYESTDIKEFKELNEITITYETTSFKLSDIYMIAKPKLLDENDLNVFDKMGELNSSINLIQENMDKIEQGSKALKKGTDALLSGSSEITNSLKEVSIAISKLQSGSIKLDDSLKEVISAITKAQDTLQNKDIEGSISQLVYLKDLNKSAIENLTKTNETLKPMYEQYIDYSQIDLINLGLNENQIKEILTLKQTYEGNTNLISLLQANNEALTKMITSLTELSKEMNSLLTLLKEALIQIEQGEQSLSDGISKLKSGIDKLYNGSISLNKGIKTLGNGINTLNSGIIELNDRGINTLSSMTNRYYNGSRKIEKWLKLKNEFKGFGSDNANDTTFIYKVKASI